jgi:hypothetical protein
MKYDDSLATFTDILLGIGMVGRCAIYAAIAFVIVTPILLVLA